MPAARPLLALLLLLLAAPALSQETLPQDTPPDETPTFRERLEVELATVPVRVVDDANHPILGLGPADFRLTVGGREVPIEAVDWLGEAPPAAAGETAEAWAPDDPPPPATGRLVVVFVQASLERSRGPGLLQMLPKLRRKLGELPPEDYVAVVSFDSHLKLRQEFTRDRERLEPALQEAMLFGTSPLPRLRSWPSLAAHLDLAAARRAARPERALELVARALEPLARPATLIYLGWGLGERGTLLTRMPPEYEAAVDSLERSRTSVFVLDAADATYHTLEQGLRWIADDTGGRYEKTDLFPEVALDLMAETLAGQYLVSYRPPAGAVGAKVRVELREPGLGRIVAPRRVARR